MINEIPIYMYIISVIASIFGGIFTAWGSLRYYDEETIFSKEFLKSFEKNSIKYILALFLNLILFFAITYFKGNIFSGSGELLPIKLLEYLKYIMITPILLIALFVDIEYRVIPNRVSLLILQIGLIFVALEGSFNIYLLTDALFGALIALGTFALITILGGIIAGKEAMGMGDLKFVTPLGLILGKTATINLILTAFILSVAVSIIIVIFRAIMRKTDKYIPFGPFLVIALYITIFIPENFVLSQCIILADQLSNLITQGVEKLES